ncbi:MAG: MBL fold metallo-hydrolase [Acidimicrobiales bacterium]|jgi:cyclase
MSTPTHHHDHPDLPPPATHEIAGGVFAYVQPDGSWWINNAGFVVGGDQICAIDTASTQRRTLGLLGAIRAVSEAPVRTLFNTHHHGDHTNGNCLFADAVILGHSNCRSNMAGQWIGGLDAVFDPVEWGDLSLAPPNVTFDERLALHVGDTRVELLYVGSAAHTTGDVVAWLPDHSVVFTGDVVFNGGTPFVLMGSVAGSLNALEVVRSLGASTIVPGHGGLCGPEQLDVVARYLRWLQGVAHKGVEAGLAPLEAARETDLGEYGEWLDPERIVGNLHRAYMELDSGNLVSAAPAAGRPAGATGAAGAAGAALGEAGAADTPLGAPADILTAFADMITYNGGRPLTCYA